MRLFTNIFIAASIFVFISGVDKTAETSNYGTAINLNTVSVQLTAGSAGSSDKIQSSQSHTISDEVRTQTISEQSKSVNPSKFIPHIRRFGFTN